MRPGCSPIHVYADPVLGLVGRDDRRRPVRSRHRRADPAYARRHIPDADARHRLAAVRIRPTARTRSPAATTACRASRSSRFSACSGSIFRARPRISMRWSCCSSGFWSRCEHGAFAVRPLARRHSPESRAHARNRHAGVVAARRDLHDLGGHGGLRRRAVGAYDALRRAEHARHCSLRHRRRDADPGRHAPALRRLHRRGDLCRGQDFAAKISPFYWVFIVGGC